MNVLIATELYTQKWLKECILCYTYFVTHTHTNLMRRKPVDREIEYTKKRR